jgi:hypothetical protein
MRKIFHKVIVENILMQKNSKGFCEERTIDVRALNLCDYYELKSGKRKNSKSRCRNCTHFHNLEISQKNDTIDRVSNDDS